MGTERLSDRGSMAANTANTERAGADVFAKLMERRKKNDAAQEARTGKLRVNGLSATFETRTHLTIDGRSGR